MQVSAGLFPYSIFNFETSGDSKNPFAVVASGSEWSQDKAAFEKYIVGVKVVGGQTTLLDAIRSIGKAVDAKATSEKLAVSSISTPIIYIRLWVTKRRMILKTNG